VIETTPRWRGIDGDADRAMFVSATDATWMATACCWPWRDSLKSTGHLMAERVGTTMANLGLERALQAEGLSSLASPSVTATCSKKCLRSGANLGGEQSGPIIFLDDATTGDGCSRHHRWLAGALRGPSTLATRPQDLSADHCEYNGESKPPLESFLWFPPRSAKATKNLGAAGRVVRALSAPSPRRASWVSPKRAEDVTTAETLASASHRIGPEFSRRL